MILPLPQTALSAGETRFIFTRALVGLGASYAIAEYFSEAILWLERRDWRVENAIFQLLQNYSPASNLHWKNDENHAILASDEHKYIPCPITAGLALHDHIELHPNQPCSVRVKHPIFLIALIGKLQPEQTSLFLDGQLVWEIAKSQCLKIPECSLSWKPEKHSAPALSHPANRVFPNAKQWATIVQAFQKTLVPENHASRNKAGAEEVNDND